MEKVVCWWSGGITSAVACNIAIDTYGKENCVVIMLDTGNEHADTYRFLKDCEKWYGLKIEVLKSDKYENIEETWFKHKSLNTAKGAICSYMLKRRVREVWEKENDFSHQVFGFEYDKKEINRAKALELNHSQTKPLFPLIENELTKEECLKIVLSYGIEVPEAYKLGFNNNNCLATGCVQGGIGYWKKIQKEMPELFEKMAKVEHDLTKLKGSPVTMLKDQSNKAKASGVQLVFLKNNPDFPEHKCLDDMKGRKVKPLKECNGFCGINELNERNETEDEINWSDIEE
jgi:3'-phosphoadenosine 5'-phosphosulfate sulfotransferase (PAPS reductase)/FAD synthetase